MLKLQSSFRQFNRNISFSKHFFDKEQFDRSPAQVNVNFATIGDAGHGKTCLSSCLTKVASNDFKSVEDFDKGSQGEGSSRTTHFEWSCGAQFRFSHTDMPGNVDYIRNSLTHFFQMDGAILVTSATKGVSQLTRDYYELLKHASSLKNQDTLLPFINYDCPEEEREELTELITEELKEFMTPKEMSHLVTGSAKDEHVVKAIADRVTELFSFEEMSEKRNQTKDFPLFWPIENVGNIPNRGTFVAGRLHSGTLKKGDKISLLQYGKPLSAVVREMEIFKKLTPDLRPGDRGGAFLRVKTEIDLKRGLVVLNANGEMPDKEFQISKAWEIMARLTSFEKETTNIKGQVGFYHGTFHDGMVQISQAELKPNTEQLFKIGLRFPILARQGDPIILRRGQLNIIGHIVKSCESS